MNDAANLHNDSLVIDSHNDSAVALIRRGNVGLGGERQVPLPICASIRAATCLCSWIFP